MRRRQEDWRVGYFSKSSLQYSDEQQEVKNVNYISRWRLEPKDTAAYLRGELTEPVKPITFYLDRATPQHLRPYIIQGINDWNSAFEKAGFKNAIRALVPDDTLDVESDDLRYSVLTYAASEQSNAMGPSTIDPRTGEILEADIIWWRPTSSGGIMYSRSSTSGLSYRPLLPIHRRAPCRCPSSCWAMPYAL